MKYAERVPGRFSQLAESGGVAAGTVFIMSSVVVIGAQMMNYH